MDCENKRFVILGLSKEFSKGFRQAQCDRHSRFEVKPGVKDEERIKAFVTKLDN